MKIALLGGGGFRTPLTFAALQLAAGRLELHELALHDVDAARLETMRRVLDAMQSRVCGRRLTVTVTTDLRDALTNASYVLSAIRVGGLQARAIDERLAIESGVVGQETVGAGGLCLIMRSVAIVSGIAEQVERVAPHAWMINFTNPVGAISSVLREKLGDRVIGVCDTPAGLARRVATLLDLPVEQLFFDYFGLNHLGWLRSVLYDGDDLLSGLLADDTRLSQLEETHLFGLACLRELGLVPIEYLVYFYSPDRHLAAVAESGRSRAEYLLDQQREFYAAAAVNSAESFALWDAARAERDRSYLSDTGLCDAQRLADPGTDGYARVAVNVLESLVTGSPSHAIADVANGSTLPFLPPDATVEVPCVVDARGVALSSIAPVPEHARNLMQRVHAAERAAIHAARTRSRADAIAAFAAHPLVNSTSRAERLFDAYVRQHGELAALFS